MSSRCRLAALLLAAALAACETIQVRRGAERIPVYFSLEQVKGCAYLGEVIGSEGHWYSSWLLANERMTDAALNDLRNKAQEKGADAVYVPAQNLLFSTSMTILGQAFICRK